jgi:hypothetical protein
MFLGLARAVTLRSKSRRTYDHILLSHLRLPQPGGPGSHIYIPREQGGPVIPPGTGLGSSIYYPGCYALSVNAWGKLLHKISRHNVQYLQWRCWVGTRLMHHSVWLHCPVHSPKQVMLWCWVLDCLDGTIVHSLHSYLHDLL